MVEKTYIVRKIKENIESESMDFARNFLAKEYNSKLDTPEAKVQVDTATRNMEQIMIRINWLKKYLKDFSKKK